MTPTLLRPFVFPVTLAVCLVFAADRAASQPDHEDLLWPLDRSTRYLTSNFMEYRGGRFHAGIDLKTNSQTGYVVRAVEDGHISRVRATPSAYGRAVYLEGVSGRTYVFAHLMRFNDVLRARVRQAQAEAGGYRVGLSLRPGEIPVRKGEILALSGESGTLGPHLHFEVRDGQGWPLDPQAHGFAVPDTIAPVIETLTAWPVTADTRLNGQSLEQRLTDEAAGLAGELPPLAVDGVVAFSARITEISDIRGHRLEPWFIEVRLDGETVYSCRNETFGWDQNSLQRLEWLEYTDSRGEGFRERWLHRRPGNQLVGRQGGLWYLGAGGQGLDKGAHLLEITAADRAGNRTTARLTLVVGDNPRAGSRRWEAADLSVLVDEDYRLTPFLAQGDPMAMGGCLRSLDRDLGDPVLAPTVLLIRSRNPVPVGDGPGSGLQPAGPAAEFLAADWPVDGDVVVEFPVEADAAAREAAAAPDVGVYRRKKNGEWSLVSALLDGDRQRLAFPLAEPGLHAVLRDGEPPLISVATDGPVLPHEGPGWPGLTMPRWQVLPVQVRDLGSGVAPETIVVKLDGRTLIAEPDLPRDRILVELPDSVAPGEHTLEIEAADEAGNLASASFRVICQETRP